MKSRLVWLGATLATAAGVGAAILATGASAGPQDRVITIVGSGKTLTVIGTPDADDLSFYGEQSECCLTINGSDFSYNSNKCHASSSGGAGVECNVSHLKSVEAPLGPGDDVVTIAGDFSIITIHGSTGADNFAGSHGPDELDGDRGNDILSGGGGKDRIDGGKGKDLCLGGQRAEIKHCE